MTGELKNLLPSKPGSLSGQVQAHIDRIEEALANGYSYDEVAAALAKLQIDVTTINLRSIVSRLRRRRSKSEPLPQPRSTTTLDEKIQSKFSVERPIGFVHNPTARKDILE